MSGNNLGGYTPADEALPQRVKSQAPPIAAPSCRLRTDATFDIARTRGPFHMPVKRSRDLPANDDALSAPRVVPVRYTCDAYDARWLQSAAEMFPRLRAALTPTAFEATVTALEVAHFNAPATPTDHVVPDDATMRALEGPRDRDVIDAVRKYWNEKRSVHYKFPLVPELAAWPREKAGVDHLPFLSRDAAVEEWVLAPPPGKRDDEKTEARKAFVACEEFTANQVALLDEMVTREALKRRHLEVSLYELKLLRMSAEGAEAAQQVADVTALEHRNPAKECAAAAKMAALPDPLKALAPGTLSVQRAACVRRLMAVKAEKQEDGKLKSEAGVKVESAFH